LTSSRGGFPRAAERVLAPQTESSRIGFRLRYLQWKVARRISLLKRGENFDLTRLTNNEKVERYKRLMKSIQEIIYEPEEKGSPGETLPRELKVEYDFTRLLRPLR
jgi:hypothetical protein